MSYPDVSLGEISMPLSQQRGNHGKFSEREKNVLLGFVFLMQVCTFIFGMKRIIFTMPLESGIHPRLSFES